MVSIGFAIFLLSSTPPTRRLGLFVASSTVLTCWLVLQVFPALLTRDNSRATR